MRKTISLKSMWQIKLVVYKHARTAVHSSEWKVGSHLSGADFPPDSEGYVTNWPRVRNKKDRSHMDQG